jgi:hypoxanthine phosphoribosyltransferase
MASYSGTSSTENVRELIGFDENLAGKTVVILEDIVDSGITLKKILETLKQSGAAEVIVVALLLKPEAFRMDFEIDYIGMKIPNDFIVGYGMDYDRLGRNLKDIYRIVE